MSLNKDGRQALVLAQVSSDLDLDLLDVQFLTPLIEDVWNKYAWKDRVYPFLPELYVKRELLQMLEPRLRKKVDIDEAAGVKLMLSQQFRNLQDSLKAIHGQITDTELKAHKSRPGVLTPLKQKVQIPPPCGAQNDAFDPAYVGSPYTEIPRLLNTPNDATIPSLPGQP